MLGLPTGQHHKSVLVSLRLRDERESAIDREFDMGEEHEKYILPGILVRSTSSLVPLSELWRNLEEEANGYLGPAAHFSLLLLTSACPGGAEISSRLQTYAHFVHS